MTSPPIPYCLIYGQPPTTLHCFTLIWHLAWGHQIFQQNNYVLLCNAFSFQAVDFLGKIARRAGVWLGPPLWQTHWQIWLMVPVIRWSIVEELIDGQRQTILYCRRTSGHRHTKLMALVFFPPDCVPPNAYRPMWNSAPECLRVDHLVPVLSTKLD